MSGIAIPSRRHGFPPAGHWGFALPHRGFSPLNVMTGPPKRPFHPIGRRPGRAYAGLSTGPEFRLLTYLYDAKEWPMTAQIHEILILDGEKTSMMACPPLPRRHPRILEAGADRARDKPDDSFIFSTACWRRYQGTWEIKDDQFYLVGLRGRFQLGAGEPIRADWVSGILCVPRGELLEYVHMDFESVYEQELHIEIERGRVVNRTIIDNRGRKHDDWDNEVRLPEDDVP